MIPAWVKKKPTMQPEWDACLMTLEGHNSRITASAFSPDSKMMASSNDYGVIKIWDADTGACLNTVSTHHSEVYKLAFLPGESSIYLASAGRGLEGYTIKILDPFNETPPLKSFALLSNWWHEPVVAFITDKTAVCEHGTGTLIKLDLDTGAVLDTINLPADIIAVSPDGQTIITSLDTVGGGYFQVWDWCNPRRCRFTVPGWSYGCFVEVSPDSAKLSSRSQYPSL